MKTDGEAGFTLLELTVALSIMALVAMMALLSAKMAAEALQTTVNATAQTDGAPAIARLSEELTTEARTALAVSAPTSNPLLPPSAAVVDVLFYSQDDAGGGFYWGYKYDKNAKTISRLDLTGMWPNLTAVDSNVVLSNVTSFTATSLRADVLASQSTYGKALNGAGGIVYSSMVLPGSGVTSGNSVAVLNFSTATASREIHLMAGSVPSTFTIVSTPSIHVVVYRVDTVSRSWLGVAQKTTAHIRDRVSVAYPSSSPIAWCDKEITPWSGSPDDDSAIRDHWIKANASESANTLIQQCASGNSPMPSYKATPSAAFTPAADSYVYDTPPPQATAPPCSEYPNSPYCSGPTSAPSP